MKLRSVCTLRSIVPGATPSGLGSLRGLEAARQRDLLAQAQGGVLDQPIQDVRPRDAHHEPDGHVQEPEARVFLAEVRLDQEREFLSWRLA